MKRRIHMSQQTLTDFNGKPNIRRAESGQAIVLVALVMVVLLGALGLGIDGGGLYFLWRDAQNASDAAVLAAAYARCTGGDWKFAALQAAAQNGFDNNGQSNQVAVFSPPTIGTAKGNPNYIQVDITAIKPSYFIHLVYKGPLQVTTRAVGFCIPPLDRSTVPAVFAASLTCSNAIHWTNSTSMIQGGMFSNSDILMSGGGNDNTVIGDSGAVKTVDYQDQNTTWYSGDPPAPTTPTNNAQPKSDPLNMLLADYAPGGPSANKAPLYKAIFSAADDPDYKNGTWNPVNGRSIEGLYYVQGDVSIGTNVIVDGDRNGDGKHLGLTIVATGQISINTGSGMTLNYYSGGGGDGLIAFSGAGQGRSCGYNAIDISGSAVAVKGVVYAPYGGVNFNLSNLTMYGAIIGNTITMGGSDFTLIYDPTLLPPRPPSIQVAE
jgi:Putative Flp pilus-assembly TadE/G-like